MLAAAAVIVVSHALFGAAPPEPAPNPLPIEPRSSEDAAPAEKAPDGEKAPDAEKAPADAEKGPDKAAPPGDDEKKGDKGGKKRRAPKADISVGGLGKGPCWGSAVACGAAGCPPGVGTAIGAGVFVTSINAALAQGGGALGACFTAVGAGGIIVGVPSAIVLGPCASGGALLGGAIGAAIDDRDLTPVVLGALPGLVTGLAASATAVWGLTALSTSSADLQTPALILGTSAALAFASGPLTVAGITVADGVAGSHPRNGKSIVPDFGKKDDDTAEAHFIVVTGDVTGDVSAVASRGAMAF